MKMNTEHTTICGWTSTSKKIDLKKKKKVASNLTMRKKEISHFTKSS